jgi:hypothetical protein
MSNIRIIKNKLISNVEREPIKIIGFSVENDNNSRQIYHETILHVDTIFNKSDAECIDIAFMKLSSSIAVSIETLNEDSNIIGSYYVP